MLAQSATQYIIDENGEKTAIILPLTIYRQLLADLHDLSVIAERRDEPTVDLETLLHELDIEPDELQS